MTFDHRLVTIAWALALLGPLAPCLAQQGQAHERLELGPWLDPTPFLAGDSRYNDVVLVQNSEPAAPADRPPSQETPQTSEARRNAFDATSGVGVVLDMAGSTTISPLQMTVGVQGDGLPNMALVQNDTDAASVTNSAPGVIRTEKRTPIITRTVLRGRQPGQSGNRGSYWFPAREDLDTMLSKIDSSLVNRIVAITGPYTALYGPFFSFYDVEMLDAPRYDCGCFHNHGSTSLDYVTNGDQWNGRQSLWGGNSDWGYRVGYSHRTGSDYSTGNGTQIPASYKSRTFDTALGADLTRDSRVDFRFLRLDQTDVEIPGQFFDINFLVTDGYEIKYVLENQCRYDRMTFETWYNRTRFEGDNFRQARRDRVPFLDQFNIFSTTDVDSMSTGYRLAFGWGEWDDATLTAGTDFRYLKQRLNEFTSLLGVPQPNTPIPRSHWSNPGLFTEAVVPMNDRLQVRAGGRVDWVSTNADSAAPPGSFFPNLEAELLGEFDQHFNLWSAYLVADYEIDCHWTLTGGGGRAMRAPSMTMLYAAGPFVAVVPQFYLTNLRGNPNLQEERLWQIDLGLRGEFSRFRGGIQGFYAWIDDYITLDYLGAPTGFDYSPVNTDLATLSGGEAYGEYDLSSYLTAFANASYVEGRDHGRTSSVAPIRQAFLPGTPRSFDPTGTLVSGEKEPLFGIPPLEARTGLRLHAPSVHPHWSVEISARIVDNQDRFASSLREQPTPGFTVYDLRTFWQSPDGLLLTAGVENFTDKQYQEHLDTHLFSPVFQPGVSFYFGVEQTY